MDIYTLDGLNGAVGIVDNFQSVIWNQQYFGQSDLQLVAPATEKNIELLTIGTMLVRATDIAVGEIRNVMVIESVKMSHEEDKGFLLIITGKGLKHILSRRIVWSQLTYENETVENIIRDVLVKNLINPPDTDRAIPGFTLAAAKGFEETADLQLFSENIGEWLENICTEHNYGWDVYIKNSKYVFELYKGTDRTYNSDSPVVFSPRYDNLFSSTYQNSLENYANTALVGGEGEGVDKKSASIGSATGLDRYEGYIDGSSVSSNNGLIFQEDYAELLKSYGETEIKQFQKTQVFEGEIEPNGMFKLNVDYFLGDVVQIENERGIKATPRITEIIYSEDENGTKIVPTFSEWEVN